MHQPVCSTSHFVCLKAGELAQVHCLKLVQQLCLELKCFETTLPKL